MGFSNQVSGVKYTARYAIFGFAFGAIFPVIATIVGVVLREEGVTLSGIVATHGSSPLYYVFDTVPVFFALFSAATGWRQDTIGKTLHALQRASESLQETNETLAERNRELVEASLLKSQFLANTSHEFRTPLNAIIGFSRLMLRKTVDVLPERQLKNLRMINESGHHLLEMVDNILDIERIEAGEFALKFAEVDIIELVDHVAAKFTPRAAEKSITISVVSELERATVGTDPMRLRQVLDNFVGNAIKYSDTGEIQIVVLFLEEEGHEKVEVCVCDQGIGISEADLERIFDRFYQVDGGITRTQGGVGLGLHVVERLTEALGGELVAASELGVGSSFGIRLPCRQARRSGIFARAAMSDSGCLVPKLQQKEVSQDEGGHGLDEGNRPR